MSCMPRTDIHIVTQPGCTGERCNNRCGTSKYFHRSQTNELPNCFVKYGIEGAIHAYKYVIYAQKVFRRMVM